MLRSLGSGAERPLVAPKTLIAECLALVVAAVPLVGKIVENHSDLRALHPLLCFVRWWARLYHLRCHWTRPCNLRCHWWQLLWPPSCRHWPFTHSSALSSSSTGVVHANSEVYGLSLRFHFRVFLFFSARLFWFFGTQFESNSFIIIIINVIV